MTAEIIVADVRDGLATLADQSVQCVVTSPPYFGLRDYGVDGQIGQESTPDEYVATIVDVFRGVWRVLADDGVVWLNLGDTYVTRASAGSFGAKNKDLLGIPWRVAFALQADGWYLRSDIVWSKPNAMPESVRDRPTRAHEYIFLITKSARYAYNADAIKTPPRGDYAPGLHGAYAPPVQEPHRGARRDGAKHHMDKQRGHGRRHAGFNDRWDAMTKREQSTAGANRRSVWTVATSGFHGAHFATFPEALVEPCILAGSRESDTILDPFAGSGTVGVVALRHNRRFVGIELNYEYAEMARRRITGDAPLLNETTLIGGAA